MALTAGKKPRYAREIDVSNYQDLLGISAANAQKLDIVRGYSVVDHSGTHHNILECVSLETTVPTMTDFGAMAVGSSVFFPKITTPAKYWKCASTATPALGDWWKEELTQHS